MSLLNTCPTCHEPIGEDPHYVVDSGNYFHLGCYDDGVVVAKNGPALVYVTTDGKQYVLDRMPRSNELAAMVNERMTARDGEILRALWATFTGGDPLRRWGG